MAEAISAATRVWRLRPVAASDDAAIARIIRQVMPEFGASGDGFAINDPEVDWMSHAYAQPRHAYFVLEMSMQVFGGAGIAPLAGGDAQTCELRKMYLLPEARGIGAGAALMQACLQSARSFGFARCYLETLRGMDAAMNLYRRSGFLPIDQPLGATGHGGCNMFFLREL